MESSYQRIDSPFSASLHHAPVYGGCAGLREAEPRFGVVEFFGTMTVAELASSNVVE